MHELEQVDKQILRFVNITQNDLLSDSQGARAKEICDYTTNQR